MNNNLKICLSIYITMSSTEKSNVSNLEGEKYSPKTPSDSPPPLATYVVKHPVNGEDIKIPVIYKDIYERIDPDYKRQLLAYKEEYRN